MYTNIYISSHEEDLDDVRSLSKYLKQLSASNAIQVYSKNDIEVGDYVVERINKFIKFSKIIVCILTVDYLTECSDEIEGIFEYDTISDKIIVPIILKNCLINDTRFEHYKPLDFNTFDKSKDQFWNEATRIINKIYKSKVVSEDDIYSEELVPKAFAGTSIASDLRLVNINADINNNEKFSSLGITGNKLMIRVIGESMTPDINNHDIVLCKEIETKTNVYSPSQKKSIPNLDANKFYVVETRNDGVLIKKIQEQKGMLILVSSNKSFSPQIISKDEIISIWEVVSLVRNFGGN